MILVDTSVWVDHLRDGEVRLAEALNLGQVVIHPFVIGELACGNLSNRGEILRLLNNLPAARRASDEEALFLIERLQGLAAAGVYSVAVHLAELLWLLSSAFTVAAYHRIAGTDAEAAARLTLSTLRIGVALALAAALPLGALAWWALPAVLGPAYADARGPLQRLVDRFR